MFFCPVCNNEVVAYLPFGKQKRNSAQCPHCKALERHRLVWAFFNNKTDLFNGLPKSILHVAPERCLSDRLSHIPNLNYLSADFMPGRAMVQMDLRKIRYPNAQFDIIYCSHVLEHIIEDITAISEMNRVLKDRGWAVFQVPILGNKTFEDHTITDPVKREALFGQWDHVRKYGLDFTDRLSKGGFYCRYFKIAEIMDQASASRFGLEIKNSIADEYIFLCIKNRSKNLC